MRLDKMEDKFQAKIDGKNKVALLEQDKADIAEFFKSSTAKEKVKQLSLTEIYRLFKGSGFSGDKKDLIQILADLGVREKTPIQQFVGKTNFKKCEMKLKDKEGNSYVCAGSIVSMSSYFIGFIGNSKSTYKSADFVRVIRGLEDGNSIIYKIGKILEDCGIKGTFICKRCRSAYKVNQVRGKNRYVFNKNLTDFIKDKSSIICEKLMPVLMEADAKYHFFNKTANSNPAS